MKNIITAFALVVVFFCQAQDDDRMKPQQKSISAELNIIPFSSNPINMPYLRVRGFLKDNHAIRFGVSVSGRTENGSNDSEGKTFSYSLRPGYEYHFKGNRRLSPYIGADIEYSSKKSEYHSTESGNVDITGVINTSGEEQGFKRFGVNALAGVDIYLIKRLYIGFELGFGWSKTTFVDVEITQNGNVTLYDGSKLNSYGPTLNRAFRLGFFFN